MYKRLPNVKKSLERLNKNIPENALGVHGTLYDISKLNHPGGHVFIYTSLGTDATSLFETHHLDICKLICILKMQHLPKPQGLKNKCSIDIYQNLFF